MLDDRTKYESFLIAKQHLYTTLQKNGATEEELGDWYAVIDELGNAAESGGLEGLRRKENFYRQWDPEGWADVPKWGETPAPSFAKFSAVTSRHWVDAQADDDLGLTSTAALFEMDLPDPKWIVENMIPEGDLTFVVSDGGIGKSWLLMALAETLSGGGHTFLGNYCEPCNVVYLDMELGRAWFRNRLRLVQRGLFETKNASPTHTTHTTYHLDSPNLTLEGANKFLERLPPLPGEEIQEPTAFDYLRAVIIQAKARVLIIDPIANLWGIVNENDTPETNAVCKALKSIAVDTGAALVIAHHTNKSRTEERGSTAIRNSAAAMFNLIKPQNNPIDGLLTLTTNKSRHGKNNGDMYLRFGWDASMFQITLATGDEIKTARDDVAQQKLEIDVQSLLDTLGSCERFALNKTTLADKCDLGSKRFPKALKAALSGDRIEEEKRGRGLFYALKI